MFDYHLKITGLDCVDCARGLAASIEVLPNVAEADLQFYEGILRVRGEIAESELRRTIRKLGYDVADDAAENPVDAQNAFMGFWRYLWQRLEGKLALAGGGIVLFSLLIQWFEVPTWLPVGLQLTAFALGLWPIARSAVITLWSNHTFNINFLMTLAGIGAVVIGETMEAASMIFLFVLAETLEGFTNERARRTLGGLKDLTPTHAIRLSGDEEHRVPVAEVEVGDQILVRSGERIPLDGVVVNGQSDVNQAPITGESMPVWKEPDDEVFSGSVNGSGRLVMRVTHLAADSTLHRIIDLVTEAQSRQSQSQKFIDRFARYYTPAMVVVAFLLASLPPLLFGQPFLNLADGTRGWLHRSLALLVIGCPCALVISTPVTMVASLTRAAREGVLFKGGIFVEGLSRIKTFAFDKTGTLTRGEPVVVDLRDLACKGEAQCAPCDDILALAYALERHSSHPLANAIITKAEAQGVTTCYPPAENLTARGGLGLQGVVNDRLMTIGSLRLFEAEHAVPAVVRDWVLAAESQGQTAMLLCDGRKVRGFITVADSPREEARQVIQKLHQQEKQTVMLTGDNPSVGRVVGEMLGLSDVRAGLLPEEKQVAVAEFREQVAGVAMVGDGINDAPALAAADIGIAMGGSGNAQAMETADIVLMADGIEKLPFAVGLSGFANRLIRQNIVISLGSKLLVAVMALLGYAPLWLAVLADMGVSLLVTANGLRALRYQLK